MKDPADSNLDQHQPILSFLEFDENTPDAKAADDPAADRSCQQSGKHHDNVACVQISSGQRRDRDRHGRDRTERGQERQMYKEFYISIHGNRILSAFEPTIPV